MSTLPSTIEPRLQDVIAVLKERKSIAPFQVQLLATHLLRSAFGFAKPVRWTAQRDPDGTDKVQLTALIACVPHEDIPISYWVSVIYEPPTPTTAEPNDPFDATVCIDIRQTKVAQVWYRFDVERRQWAVINHWVAAT